MINYPRYSYTTVILNNVFAEFPRVDVILFFTEVCHVNKGAEVLLVSFEQLRKGELAKHDLIPVRFSSPDSRVSNDLLAAPVHYKSVVKHVKLYPGQMSK